MDPPLTLPRKRTFSSDKYSLKSPLALGTNRSQPAAEGSGSKVRKRFSGAFKRLSGGKSTTTKPIIIPNSARAPDGPDTPLPGKSGSLATIPPVDLTEYVQYSNEKLQAVYERAKKSLKIKTSDERRRESLKEKIVIVGNTDRGKDLLNLLLADTDYL